MAKTKKRIILTGAQGTGKTTLMNELAKDGTKTLSIARETAVELGWPVAPEKLEGYQKTLFSKMQKALSSKKNYISDRGLTCVAAHTFSEALVENITKKTADSQYLKLQKFHKEAASPCCMRWHPWRSMHTVFFEKEALFPWHAE
jgi:predicted ATPase